MNNLNMFDKVLPHAKNAGLQNPSDFVSNKVGGKKRKGNKSKKRCGVRKSKKRYGVRKSKKIGITRKSSDCKNNSS